MTILHEQPAIVSVFAPERQDAICRLISDEGRVRVADLANRFSVSQVTIRKDLEQLELAGRVTRTHGGAIAGRAVVRPEPAFAIREWRQQAEKSAIGRVAADLITEGESIALDASSSALYLARELLVRDWHQLTVLTNSIRIALELAGKRGVTVRMLGGRVRSEALSVVGPLGESVFRHVNVQKAFVGAVGFTLEVGLSDSMEEEAQVKRAMVAAAREVYALVDHTKWGRDAATTFCRADRLTGVVTDAAADPAMVAELRAAGVEVIVASAELPPPTVPVP